MLVVSPAAVALAAHPISSALFPLTALLLSVKVPTLKMPPPPPPVPPLRIVTPLMFTVIPEPTTNTLLLGRTLLLPSMMVVEAPPPVMVRLPVISSSLTMVRDKCLAAE